MQSELQLSDRKKAILKALSKYKYLTVSHIIDLGISQSPITVRAYLRDLREAKLTLKTAYSGVIQENGKTKTVNFEVLNFLDKEGVSYAKKILKLDNIKYPKSYKLAFSNDYLHRVLIVSTCISFEKWRTEKDLKGGFLVDFHNSETTIKIDKELTVKPDLIVNFKQTYSIVEIWAGLEKEYIINQLSKLTKAIASKKISEFLEYERTPRILNIFKDKGTMERVKQELKTDLYFTKVVEKGLFFFASMDDIKRRFNFWQDINGNWFDIENF